MFFKKLEEHLDGAKKLASKFEHDCRILSPEEIEALFRELEETSNGFWEILSKEGEETFKSHKKKGKDLDPDGFFGLSRTQGQVDSYSRIWEKQWKEVRSFTFLSYRFLPMVGS